MVGNRGFEDTVNGIRDYVNLTDLPSVITGIQIGPRNGSSKRLGILRKFLSAHGVSLAEDAIETSIHAYR